MRRLIVSIVWLGIVLAVADCVATSNRNQEPPQARVDTPSFWNLTAFPGVPLERDAILELSVQSFALDVPCYRRAWAYSTETGKPNFPNPYASEKRCDIVPPIVAAFDRTLPTVFAVHASDDELVLLDSGGNPVLIGKRLRSSGLENREWSIESYFDGTSLLDTAGLFTPPLMPRISFIHGSLYGSPGCGGLVGRYSLRGPQVTIHAGYILDGFCYPRDIALSDRVREALDGERSMQRTGGGFELRDNQGQVRIILTPKGAE
jgi:hypothetical protein